MFGITHPLMGEMVQAAVTIRPDTTDDQTEIITYCRRRLSRYKVPSIVFVVKELPTSANGKVMKQSLREQCQDVATPSRRNSTPSTISNAFSSPMKGSTSTHRRASTHNFLTAMNYPEFKYPSKKCILLGGSLIDALGHAELLFTGVTRTEATIVVQSNTAWNSIRDTCMFSEMIHRYFGIISKICFVSDIRNHNCVQAAISIVQRTAVGAIVKVSTFTGTDEGHVGHNANRARQHRLECTEKNTKILENYDSVLNAVQLALRQICPKQYYLVAEGSVPLTNAGLSIQTLTQFQAVLEVNFGVSLTPSIDSLTIHEISEHIYNLIQPAMTTQKSVARVIHNAIASTLGLALRDGDVPFDENMPLMDAGLSSLGAVQLQETLSREFGEEMLNRPIPATLAFDYPSINQIKAFFIGSMIDGPNRSEQSKNSVSEISGQGSKHITGMDALDITCHILGIECRAPGSQIEISSDTRLTLDSVSVTPLSRWDLYFICAKDIGDLPPNFGGMLPNISTFDTGLVRMGKAETDNLDPQQRLVLTSTISLWIMDSSVARCQSAKFWATFIGMSRVEYPIIYQTNASVLGPHHATGSHLSVTAGRVAFVLGLGGAAGVVDTACSSSLVACMIARSWTLNDMKLIDTFSNTQPRSFAGGINLTLCVFWSLACTAAQMLSSEGRCKTFDRAANGYVRSEAIGILHLSGNSSLNICHQVVTSAPKYVQIIGVSSNQDGRSSALTAPNGPAQHDAIRSCLVICRIDPRQFSTLQTHGTGTALGDPIEVNAAIAAFCCDSASRLRPLELAACKSICGHAEPAAGILGQFAAINELNLLWRHPLTHLRGQNTHIIAALKSTPSGTAESLISFSKQIAEHTDNSGYSSVSAFAFQGTNANSSLLAVNTLSSNCKNGRGTLLNQKSYWHQPLWHAWLQRCSVDVVGPHPCILYRVHVSPAIANLKDHVVHSRMFCPVAAYMEISVGILRKQDRNIQSATVCYSTIPCPMLLNKVNKCTTVDVHVCCKTSKIQVKSFDDSNTRSSLHLDCTVHETIVSDNVPWNDTLKHITKWDDGIFINLPLCAVVSRTSNVTSQPESTIMDPGSLDSLIHLPEGTGAHFRGILARVPVAIKAFRVSRQPVNPCFAWCSASDDATGNDANNHHGMCGVRIIQLHITRPRARTDMSGKLRQQPFENMHQSVYAIDRLTRPSKTATFAANTSNFRVCSDIYTRKLTYRQTSAFLELAVFNVNFKLISAGKFGDMLQGTARSLWHESVKGFSLRIDTNDVPLGNRHVSLSDPLIRETFSRGTINSAVLIKLNMAHREKRGMSLSVAIEKVFTKTKRLCRCRLIKTSKTGTASVGVIFGGLGKLGESVTSHLFMNVSITFVMSFGRTGRSRSLLSDSYHMSAFRADTTRASEAKCAVNSVRLLGHILVFNLCGTLADAHSAQQCPGRIRPTFASKARCAFLEFFELQLWRISFHFAFSSLTALMGNAGQTGYAAANAALDADAEARRNEGTPCMSIQWGAWSGGGMASGLESRMIQVGVGLIHEKEGLYALQHIVDGEFGCHATLSVCAFHWPRYNRAHKYVRDSKFLQNFQRNTSNHIKDLEGRCLWRPIADSKVDELLPRQKITGCEITCMVKTAVSLILGHSISSSAPLIDAGFDSLSSLEFAAALDQSIRSAGLCTIELPVTLIFDYPNQDAIIEFLSSKLSHERNTSQVFSEVPSQHAANSECNFSKLDPNLQVVSIFSLVREIASCSSPKTDKVVRLPLSRWDWDICSCLCATFGGFISNPASFDNEKFSISHSESVTIDPQQRILLICCAVSIPKVHGVKFSLQQNMEVGVMIGMSTTDYYKLANDVGTKAAATTATGSAFLSVAAGRISFVLNTNGPALSIDTACSSGLVALHMATQSLLMESGHMSRCIVGGVNLVLHWSTSAMFASAGMLANDGRCKALDSRADGYGRSEACVVLFVGSLFGVKKSQNSDGGSVAIVAGSSINQDGRSSSLTAPSGPSQKLSIQLALADLQYKHHICFSISTLQTHGTGTPLGDPIEIGAICTLIERDLTCAVLILGATKTSFAHSESSAGLVSVVIAVMEQIRQDLHDGLHHVTHVNPHISSVLKIIPVETSIERQIAPAFRYSGCRNGKSTSLPIGCNAFAFQGTNAHLILIQWPDAVIGLGLDGPQVPAWCAERFWLFPTPHRIIAHFSLTGCKFACIAADLGSTSWIKDHIVRERIILPGAGALEIAQATACIACLSNTFSVAVGGVSIASPLELSNFRFDVKLDVGLGVVRIGSPVIGMTITGRIHTNTINHDNSNARCEFEIRTLFFIKLYCFLTYDGCTPHETCAFRGAFEGNIFSRISCCTNDGLLMCPAALDATFQSLSATWHTQSQEELTPVELNVPTAFATYAVIEKLRTNSSVNFARSQLDVMDDIHGAKISDHNILYRCDVKGMASKPVCYELKTSNSPSSLTALIEERRKSTSPGHFVSNHNIVHRTTSDARHLLCMLQAPMCIVRQIASANDYLLGGLRSVVMELPHMELNEEPGLQVACGIHISAVGFPEIYDDGKYSLVNIISGPNNIWRNTRKFMTGGFRQRPLVVVGGLGALGQVITTHAAINWKNSVIFVQSRVGRSVANIFPGVCLMVIYAADVCVASFRESCFPRNIQSPTVVNTAGVLRDTTTANIDAIKIRTVLASKCARQIGSNHSVQDAIHVSCLFSSIAVMLGSPGQAGYSAANARLDETARRYANAGLPVCSVQWGPWEAIGMADMDCVNVQRLRNRGLHSIQLYEGMQFFEAILELFETSHGGHAVVTSVSRTDWNRYVAAVPMARGCARLLFQNFVEIPKNGSEHHYPRKEVKTSKTSQRLTLVQSCIDLNAITEQVISIVRQFIGGEFPLNLPFMEAGLDSLTSVELVYSLSNAFSIKLAATVIFDYPSIDALANYVCGLLKPCTTLQYSDQMRSDATAFQMDNGERSSTSVQMKCWSLSGDDSCFDTTFYYDRPDKVPISRWDAEKVGSVKNLPSAFAAFISSPEAFDQELFHISFLEASITDPQQRLVLTGTLKIITPNISREIGSAGRRGVYVGLASCDFSLLSASTRDPGSHCTSAFAATAFFSSVTPGRTSYVFGLTGPSIAFDTACSSSLVALNSAFIDLKSLCINKLSDVEHLHSALVGGVNVMLTSFVTGTFESAGMLSSSGRCKTLAEDADGYVRGEACIMLLLEKLQECQINFCGTPIIASAAVNQDGRSSTLTAPNGHAQRHVISLALFYANEEVSNQLQTSHTLEMHGTGTPLGDPVEIGASQSIFTKLISLVTAAKTAMGHCEPAAGMCGLICIAEKVINLHIGKVGVLHLRTINPHVAEATFEHACFRGSRELAAIAQGKESYKAGVSAFAFQGTNTHVRCFQDCDQIIRRSHLHKIIVTNPHRVWMTPIRRASIFSSSVCNDANGLSIVKSIALDFVSDCKPQASPYLDHVISGHILFPGSGLLHLAYNAVDAVLTKGSDQPEICTAVIPAPLKIHATMQNTLTVSACLTHGEIRIESFTATHFVSCTHCIRADHTSLSKTYHMKEISREALRAFHTKPIDSSFAYQCMVHAGLQYGPSFRLMCNIWYSGERGRAIASIRTLRSQLCAMPSIIDSSMQLAAPPIGVSKCLRVPAAVGGYLQTTIKEDDTISIEGFGVALAFGEKMTTADHVMTDHVVSNVHSNQEFSRLFEMKCKPVNSSPISRKNETQNLALNTLFSPHLRAMPISNQNAHSTPTSLRMKTSSLRASLAAAAAAQAFKRERLSFHLPSSNLHRITGSSIATLLHCFEQENPLSCSSNRDERCIDGIQMLSVLLPDHSESIKNGREISTGLFFNALGSGEQKPHVLKAQRQSSSRYRTLIVTGGTGALGNTIVTDNEVIRNINHTKLTGRSGRTGKSSFAKNTAHLTIVRHTNMTHEITMRLFTSPGSLIFKLDGKLCDCMLQSQTVGTFRTVFEPKMCIRDPVSDVMLKFLNAPHALILFSSIASLLGSKSQSNYAAANGILDAIAEPSLQMGIACQVIQWGAWAGPGMASIGSKRLERIGIRLISPGDGVHSLWSIVDGCTSPPLPLGMNVILSVDWANILSRQPQSSTLLGGKFSEIAELITPTLRSCSYLVSCEQHEGPGSLKPASTATTRIDDTNPKYFPSEAEICTLVHEELATLLGKDEVDPNLPIMHTGLDSLSAVDLRATIGEKFGHVLPATLFFDYPTVASAAAYIMSMLCDSKVGDVSLGQVNGCTNLMNTSPSSVRIVGTSREALEPLDTVSPISSDRWDVERYSTYDDNPSTGIQFGSFVSMGRLVGVDFSFFCVGISLEAVHLDPRQRLLVVDVASTMKAANNDAEHFALHAGLAGKDHSLLLEEWGHKENAYTGIGVESSVPVGRASFLLNLRGPAISIDTACSSSLVAVNLSLDFTRKNQSSGAFTVGVSLMLTIDMHKKLGRAGMLSSSGRCRTLDAGADGYIRGEACHTLLLSTSSMSRAFVALCGSAVNQDGRSSSLTAPNGPSQQEVIGKAIDDVSIFEDSLDYSCGVLQMHGTGTPLGDPIEFGAASIVLQTLQANTKFEASKSWNAHGEPAAGALSLCELTNNLSKYAISGLCHLRALNPLVMETLTSDDNITSLAVIARQVSSMMSTNCQGGASAFAFQGTNAHVVAKTMNVEYSSARYEKSALLLHCQRAWPATRAVASLRACMLAVSLGVNSSSISSAIVASLKSTECLNALHAAFTAVRAFHDADFFALISNTFISSSYALTNSITVEIGSNDGSAYIFKSSGSLAFRGAGSCLVQSKKRIDHSHLFAHLKIFFHLKNGGMYSQFLDLSRITLCGGLSSALNILETYSIMRLQLKSVGAFTAWEEFWRGDSADAVFTAKFLSISDSANCIDTHFEMNRDAGGHLGNKSTTLGYALEWQCSCTDPELSIVPVNILFPASGPQQSESVKSTASVLETLQHRELAGIFGGQANAIIPDLGGSITALMRAVSSESNVQISFKTGLNASPRLLPLQAKASIVALDRMHTVEIIGGLGALGMLVACWLATQTTVSTLRLYNLVGRNKAFKNLMMHPAMVIAKNFDVSIREFWNTITWHDALFGCNGILRDASIQGQAVGNVRCVFASKYVTPHHTDDLLPIKFKCQYSSLASLLGSPAQANYCSANARVDHAAARDRLAGRLSLSIQWGPWIGVGGMAYVKQHTLRRLERDGVLGVTKYEGIRFLSMMFSNCPASHPTFIVSKIDWPKLLKSRANAGPILAEFGMRCLSTCKSAAITPNFPIDINPNSTSSNEENKFNVSLMSVNNLVSRLVSDVLIRPVSFEEPLMDCGLDSLGILELHSALRIAFNHIIFPSTVMFDHPSISSIAAFIVNHDRHTLADSICKEMSQSAKNCTGRAEVVSGDGSNIALKHLSTARDCCFAIPTIRWDPEFEASRVAHHIPIHFANMIECIDYFDLKIYGVQLSEARQMDPQQRLLLDATLATTLWQTIDTANVAVAVGIQHMEYAQLCSNQSTFGFSPYVATGSALSVASGRLSYVFNYGQSAISVDTACSASLLAIHICIYAVHHEGSGGLSVAGGVNLTLSANNFTIINAAGMLSMDGRCKALDSVADGYGRGEAAGVFLISHLPAEQRSSDSSKLLFNFESTAANQDGRSGSLTAPNGISQRHVISTAVTRAAKIDNLLHFSVHGTGTVLGDPIEISAVGTVLVSMLSVNKPLVSVLVASKTALGHTEAAAGLAALMQVSQSVVFRLSVPLMHLRNVNPYVVAECCNICLPRNMIQASLGAVGVSAFAFMGSNAHVIIRSEYMGPNATKRSDILSWDKTWAWKLEGLQGTISLIVPRADVNFKPFQLCFERSPCFFSRSSFQHQMTMIDALCVATHLITCTVQYSRCAILLNHAIAIAPLSVPELKQLELDTIGGSVVMNRIIRCQVHVYRIFKNVFHVLYACFGGYTKRNVSDTASLMPIRGSTNLVRNKLFAIHAILHVGSISYSVPVAADAFIDSKTLENVHESASKSTADTGKRFHLKCTGTYVIGGILDRISYMQGFDEVNSRDGGYCHCIENNYVPQCAPIASSADVLEVVLNAVAEFSGKSVVLDESLIDLGIDSIAAVELALTLQERLGLRSLDVANIASCQTPMAMAQSLCSEIDKSKCIQKSETNVILSNPVHDQTQRSINHEIKNHELKVLHESAFTRPATLFLGAPAFGDGQLAYMRLVSSLYLGAHPVLTLERNSHAEPWPMLAAGHAHQIAQHEVNAVKVNIPTVLGGHSLGGVLAMETASRLENDYFRKAVMLLFDAPHPVQFKPDWHNISDDCDGDIASWSTGLTYMGIALQSFHCDLLKCGWFELSQNEKYSLFEDVIFQALGRVVCAREMDEQISAGPFAAQWNSGIVRDETNCTCDVSAWKMLQGTFDSAEKSASPKSCFRKIQGKAICYKAGRESSALFETELFLKEGDKVLESMTGYTWVLSCDHVEIVHCQGSHMDLMTNESDCSGDLSFTISPHVNEELARAWTDLKQKYDQNPLWKKCIPSSSREAWEKPAFIQVASLPFWQAPCVMSQQLPCKSKKGKFSVRMDAEDSLFMLGLNYFSNQGLLKFRGETQEEAKVTAVVFIQDLLSRMAEWLLPAFDTRLPCLACHQQERQKNIRTHFSDEIRACEVLKMVLDVMTIMTKKCTFGGKSTSLLRIILVALPETKAAKIAFHVANLYRCAGGNAHAFVALSRPVPINSEDTRDSLLRQLSFDAKINSINPTSLEPAIQSLATRYLEAETKLHISSTVFARFLQHLQGCSEGKFMEAFLALRPALKMRSEWTTTICRGAMTAAAAWEAAMNNLHLSMVSSHVTVMYDI